MDTFKKKLDQQRQSERISAWERALERAFPERAEIWSQEAKTHSERLAKACHLVKDSDPFIHAIVVDDPNWAVRTLRMFVAEYLSDELIVASLDGILTPLAIRLEELTIQFMETLLELTSDDYLFSTKSFSHGVAMGKWTSVDGTFFELDVYELEPQPL